MKNSYELQVVAQCPVNLSERDIYTFVIESEAMIAVVCEEAVYLFVQSASGRVA